MSRPDPRSSRVIRAALAAAGPFVGLAFIVLVFLLYDLAPDGSLEKFSLIFGSYNLRLVAAQTAIIAVGALGMTIVIIAGGIDLSPGSVMALVTVVVALMLRRAAGSDGTGELPASAAALAALAGLGTGAAAGLVNGLIITRLRIVPFIATLGTMSAARGLAKLLSGEQKISTQETWMSSLLLVERDSPLWAPPLGVLLLLALSAATALALGKTVFGRRVFAIGSNEATAILCGVRVARIKLYVYAMCGVAAAIAGILQFSQGSSGDPSSAAGKELDFIAAVVIGGGSLSGGKGSVVGTLIGASIIGLLRNGCVLYDVSNTIQEIVIGLIIIGAAAVDRLRDRRG